MRIVVPGLAEARPWSGCKASSQRSVGRNYPGSMIGGPGSQTATDQIQAAANWASELIRTKKLPLLEAVHKAATEFEVSFGAVASVLGQHGGWKSAAMRREPDAGLLGRKLR
jgi:hypothetical protein